MVLGRREREKCCILHHSTKVTEVPMRIVLFNHKGGVSKTTTAYHLGWMLAQRGHRVLLVDGDPQCNLTGLFLGDSFEEYYSNEDTARQNLMDGVRPAFDAQPQPISAVDCFTPEQNRNIFLLPGHPNLSEFEPQLSFALNSNNAFSTLQNLPGAFHALLSQIEKEYSIGYTIIDLNPGMSAINQNLFVSSDAFVLPTNPDPFSLMAIRTLKDVLPRWKRVAQQMAETFSNSSYPFPKKDIRFAGHLVQRFNIRNGVAAKPYRANIGDINQVIREELVPKLAQSGMTFSTDEYQAIGLIPDYCLAEIPDFQSLIQKSNQAGVPVFSLSEVQIGYSGAPLEQLKTKRSEFLQLFTGIAEKIENLNRSEVRV